MSGDVAVIVPAAGAGRRFGGRLNKLFVPLRDRPLLAHTLAALQRSRAVRWIVVVAAEADQRRVNALIHRWHLTKALPPCRGGASRAESVARGATRLPAEAAWVMVHDGARPCVTASLLNRAVHAAKRYGAVACGLPASVTVKETAPNGRVRRTLNRERLWLVQTPQVFRRDWLEAAFARARRRLDRFPDDAAAMEAAGFPVTMIPGEAWNLKVTTPEDLVLAEAIVRARR